MSLFPKSKIAVIGAGMVGSAFCFAAILKKVAAEIILIDVNEMREEGEVMDLDHALIASEIGMLRGGSYADCRDVDLIVITAGCAQQPGQSRLELVKSNVSILRQIIKSLPRLRSDTIVLIVSNPVDVLTMVARKELDLAATQIFGSGTALDTSRLKFFVSRELKVSRNNVHGYVLGEHGDSEFVAWSSVRVGARPIQSLLAAKMRNEIEKNIKNAAYDIIQRKRATYYGIGAVTAELAEAILEDQKLIMPLSTEPGKAYGIKGICLGVPVILGRSGIEMVWPIELTADEARLLKASAAKLKDVWKKVA